MEKKYELTNENIIWRGRTLHRIKALKDFKYVKKGELGGFVEKEENLSHEGDCWVCSNARVCDNAKVFGNAKVLSDAWVFGNAHIFDNAKVFGNARVFDNAKVYGDAWVYDMALIFNNAEVYGDAWVFDNAEISIDANIYENTGYCYISRFGPNDRSYTFYKNKDGIIRVNYGCINGRLDMFKAVVKETYGNSKYAKEYMMLADLMELKLSE